MKDESTGNAYIDFIHKILRMIDGPVTWFRGQFVKYL